jgi:8-oxo-dGTP pyrophosphatase MutT (NUDIX family)
MGVVLVLSIADPLELRDALEGRAPPPAPLGLSVAGPGGLGAVLGELERLGLAPAEVHYRRRPGPGYELRLWSGLRHLTASALVVREGRVLLLRHRRKGVWLPPGGHVEPHERPDETVAREVWEETGIEARLAGPPFDVQTVEVEPGHEHVDLVYVARPAGGRAVPGREADGLRWFAEDELDEPGVPANVARAARRALKRGGSADTSGQ